MDNKRILIFFIISILIHSYFLFIMKFEPFKEIKKKQENLTIVDLIDKKKSKKPVKNKPKSNLLAEKDIDLKKKTQKNKTDTKKPPTIKKFQPPKTEKKQVKIKQQPKENNKIVQEKKEIKKTIQKKEKALIKKKEPKKEKTEETKTVKKEIKPEKPTKNLPKSLSDLNTENIIEGFSKEDNMKSDEGDDVINLQAVGFKYASYFSKFKRLIENNWNYPRPAALRGEEGSVRVRFSILKDGTITDIKFLNSSGYPQLDREVKRVLTEIKGYPLPESWKKDRIKIEGNFVYQLYGGYVRGHFE